MSIDDPSDPKLSSEPMKDSQRQGSQPHGDAPMLASSAGGAPSTRRSDDLDLDDTLHALRGGVS